MFGDLQTVALNEEQAPQPGEKQVPPSFSSPETVFNLNGTDWMQYIRPAYRLILVPLH